MPAYIPALHAIGMKWVSGYPANQARGLPYISGLLILNDDDTGMPLAVMDCTWITGMRTGAATAVAAQIPGAARVGDGGHPGLRRAGAHQPGGAEDAFPGQARAGLRHNAGERRARYAAEMQARFDLDVTVVKNPREAVTGCDMVVTAGPILHTPHATIKAGWLDAGAFASLVDFDSYWDGAAHAGSGQVLHRRRPAARVLSQRSATSRVSRRSMPRWANW